MLLNDVSEGYFVSTADRFSEPARRAAEDAVKLGIVERIQLIDAHSFLSMLNVVQKTDGTKPGSISLV